MDFVKVERVLSIATSFKQCEDEDRAYWFSRPALERWQAMELMRQLNHGPDYASQRLQRLLEVVERPQS
jgi:hypothetical protein